MNNTDKYIFFMPAGEMQSSTVEFFKHNNFKIILCDGNPEDFLKPQADIFLSFDIFNLDECEKNLDKLINNINIVAAYTSSADCHKSIAHISEKIGSRLTGILIFLTYAAINIKLESFLIVYAVNHNLCW